MDTIYERLTDPERFDAIEGSGWSIVPGTVRFWLKVYPCQPNPDASPTENNASDYGGDNDNSDDMDPPQRECNNTFLLALAEYFFRLDPRFTRLPRTIIAKKIVLTEYLLTHMPNEAEEEWLYMRDFNLKDVAAWHRLHKKFPLRIFSLRGNVLYAKRYPQSIGNMIDMYITSKRKIGLVLKLNALFRRGLDRTLCSTCYTFHRTDNSCVLNLVEAETDQVEIPEYPNNRHALVIYADFESILSDPHIIGRDMNAKHLTSGFSMLGLDNHGDIVYERITNVLDVEPDQIIPHFMESVYKCCDIFTDLNGERMPVSSPDCKICGNFIDFNVHAFFNGRNFINGETGSHHAKCWRDPKNSAYIFFHNFRGYDSHFLMSEIVKNCNVINMQATTMERFNLIRISHNNMNICFKDTFNFFTCSLDAAIANVEHFIYADEMNNPVNRKKGVFPYDWFDNFEKLYATELPPPPWVNTMTGLPLDHTRAYEVWNAKKFKTFSEYHNYYMHLDVLILADIFEKFRSVTLSEFSIDPVHFQGAPGLTWYLGLRSNIELFRIIQDKRIYLDIQSQIRGGVSQAMQRYCKPDIGESILFLDVNSLYSYCMTKLLPSNYVRTVYELPDNWEEMYANDGEECALINVDLIYPEHLHDRDIDYPLAPHKFNDALCTTFLRKENYLCHSKVLQYYVNRGLIIEKFNYMYVFKQDYALRDYVSNNINKRRETNSAPMKALYKLLNNSLYGKTCENVFKYRIFEVHDEENLEGGQVNSFLYRAKNFIEFDNKFLCEMKPDSVKLNKPIQIGFTILEYAKLHMYSFIYDIKDVFKDDVRFLYTDTDSIMMWFNLPDPWIALWITDKIKKQLDFAKMVDKWGIGDKSTDKQSGLWSPEADGKTIVEYVGLRSKSYAYKFADNEEVIKNKGVMKNAAILDSTDNVVGKVTFDIYKNALFTGTDYRVRQHVIRSKNHEVYSRPEYKLGISGNDLKRTVLANRKDSLPFGYKGYRFRDLAVDIDDPDNFTT
uniref:DNA-directed DNA polymerase n=1 Tax=Fresh Meadows densovirus 3 TaxID=2171374 RepID=A0A2S0SZ16_9VIRU|nr:structural protein [Fresh Meadows densovirus 3]